MPEKIDLKTASIESVAFEIATRISKAESLKFEDPNYRSKFLDLYHECLTAVRGYREPE